MKEFKKYLRQINESKSKDQMISDIKNLISFNDINQISEYLELNDPNKEILNSNDFSELTILAFNNNKHKLTVWFIEEIGNINQEYIQYILLNCYKNINSDLRTICLNNFNNYNKILKKIFQYFLLINTKDCFKNIVLWIERELEIDKLKDYYPELFVAHFLYDTKNYRKYYSLVNNNPNIIDKFWKRTILHWASSLNEIELVQLALDLGIDKSIKDGDKDLAIDLTKDQKIKDLINNY